MCVCVCCCCYSIVICVICSTRKKNWREEKRNHNAVWDWCAHISVQRGHPLCHSVPLVFSLSLSLSLSLSFSRSRLEGYFPSWTKLFHLLDLFLYLIVSLTLTWLVIQLSFFMVPMQQPGPPPSFARPTRISSKLLYLLAFLLHASSSDRHNTQPDDV